MVKKFMVAAVAGIASLALVACESPSQQSEWPTIESVSWGDCYVDASDPQNPIAGRDVTVEIKNNMPTNVDPDVGSMVVSESEGGPTSPIVPALAWDDFSDEDGSLYFVDESDYNVVEPQQTATATFFHDVPETQFFLTFAAWFFEDVDSDGTNEVGIGEDDSFTVGLAWAGPTPSCDVCPPGQVWNTSGYCTTP